MKNPFKPFQEFLNDEEYAFFINTPSDEIIDKISLSSTYKLAAYILEVKDSKLSKELFDLFTKYELNTYQILMNYLDLNLPIEEETIKNKTNLVAKRKRKNSINQRLSFVKSLHDEGVIDDGLYTYVKLQYL